MSPVQTVARRNPFLLSQPHHKEPVNLGVRQAHCGVRSVKCPTCFGYCGFQVGFGDPFCSDDEGVDGFCPLDLVAKFDAMALGQNGVWVDVSSQTSAVSWSSSTPSVASSQGSGRFLGNAVGTYTGTATANLIEVNADCAGTGSPCPTDPWGGSGGGTVGAVPINLDIDSAVDAGGGDLHVVLTWKSSTGSLTDLSSCSVSESVTYPGTVNYSWPPPFPAIVSFNPTTGQVPASDGMVIDDHDLAGKLDTDFRKPYSSNSFTSQQTISYSCVQGGKTLSGVLQQATPIVRQVKQDASQKWEFTVTEYDLSAVIDPLP